MSDGSIDWHVEQACKEKERQRANLSEEIAQFLFRNRYHEKNSLEIARLLMGEYSILRK